MTISAKAQDLIGAVDDATWRVHEMTHRPHVYTRQTIEYDWMRLRDARAALEKYIAELEAGLRAPKGLLAALDGVGR